MAHRIVFRPAAEQDLFDLYAYVAENDGRKRAGALIERIEEACLRLAEFPERGRTRDDLMRGLRILPLDRRATIAFCVTADQVDILRVFSAGRDFESLLRDVD